MNLTSVPFGGFPMCHGAGGLAGQYRYGARTGGANIYAGLIFIILALFFSSPQVLSIIAVGVLGALLVFVGIEMARHSLKTDSLALTCVIGILALAQLDDNRIYCRDGPCLSRLGRWAGKGAENGLLTHYSPDLLPCPWNRIPV